MASGSAIRAKIDKALERVNATHRLIQFTKTTRVGGNPVLGIGGTVSTETVEIRPQPAVEELDAETVSTSGGLYQFGDYRLTMSGSIAESMLRNYQILYGDEILQIVRYKPSGVMQGTVVAWEVIARTQKAGS